MAVFSVRPVPTTLVRFVLMALAAIGLLIYSMRLRWRSVALFWFISWLGELLSGLKLRVARRVRLPPALLYPLACGALGFLILLKYNRLRNFQTKRADGKE